MVVLSKRSKRTERAGKNLSSQKDAELAQATETNTSSEEITGTEIADTLEGGEGADEIESGPGDDVVEGGTGD